MSSNHPQPPNAAEIGHSVTVAATFDEPNPNPTSDTSTPPDSSRRALIRSAVDSIQRFKQSWKSIMFLKAGIGLGQVVVLVVLLILASLLPSPMYPDVKQSEATDACPRPYLFQAWMAVQMFRLTICWSVSCWVAVRAQRVLRREQRREELEGHVNANESRSTSHIPRGDRQFGSQPSLTHSSSTASQTTLAGMSNASHGQNGSPPTVYTPTMHSSSATIDVLGNVETKAPDSSGDFTIQTISPPTPAFHASDQPRTSLQQARSLAQTNRQANDVAPEDEGDDAVDSRGIASFIDRVAPKITQVLGLISLLLFVLGNVLLFYPLPGEQNTCYHGAPMLWWGVMTVTGVGWVLFGQVLFVVAFVGIGGQAILAVLRRLHIVPTPPEPEPPRPPQPDPLSPQELARIRVVCFVPHPDPPSGPTTPTEIKSMADAQSAVSVKAKWDWTRFPYPAHYLKSDKAMCAICQDNFIEPQVIRRILYDAEPLRLLGCGHVYHTECVDKWLTERSGICPVCNTSVRSSLIPEKPESTEPEKRGRWWNRRREQPNPV